MKCNKEPGCVGYVIALEPAEMPEIDNRFRGPIDSVFQNCVPEIVQWLIESRILSQNRTDFHN